MPALRGRTQPVEGVRNLQYPLYTDAVPETAQPRFTAFRRALLPLFTSAGAALALPLLLGRPQQWPSSTSLFALSLAVWILDPAAAPIATALVVLAGSIVSRAFPASFAWIPDPLLLWLTVAIVLLLRVELKVRHRLVRKEAELQAERTQQQEWRAFFENSPAAILISNGEGRILMANPAARKLLGYQDQPIEGNGIAQSIAALGAALRIDRKKMLFHDLTGCKGHRPNGDLFVADAWFFVGETPAGTRLGAVVVDAGERLQERARGGLRSSMATSQIAMEAVLHEVRNLSAASALMYNNLVNAGLDRFGGLRQNADFESLGSLIKALASISATEMRPGERAYSSVNLSDVLNQLRIIIDPWFLESEMSVEWDLTSGLPEVCGEESGLLQLFLNIAQNSNRAMSSSEEKRLTITARVEGELVIVRFTDTGPGISDPDELFQPLRRGAKIRGLGLFVSRAIAHSFHGELKHIPTESGSCFQVELIPLRERQKATSMYDGKREKE